MNTSLIMQRASQQVSEYVEELRRLAARRDLLEQFYTKEVVQALINEISGVSGVVETPKTDNTSLATIRTNPPARPRRLAAVRGSAASQNGTASPVKNQDDVSEEFVQNTKTVAEAIRQVVLREFVGQSFTISDVLRAVDSHGIKTQRAAIYLVFRGWDRVKITGTINAAGGGKPANVYELVTE